MHDAKPFEATASRLARARSEGDLPRSGELTAAAGFAGGCVSLFAVAPNAVAAITQALVDATHGNPTLSLYALVAYSSLVPCAGAGACATMASVALSGGIATRALRVDMSKLQPGAGMRRMLSARAAGSGARALVAAAVAAAALVPAARSALWLSGADSRLGFAPEATVHAIVAVLVTACLVGLCFGVLDALLERAAWRRRLRMSVEEMKRDLKQSEGDPHIRNRRRAQHRALIRGALSRLPEASFVVANPTHVAVALEYRPPKVTVPRVLIRAVDGGARLVKARARALGIPVVEDVTLARTLLAHARVDEAIPRMCYLAVARIVATLLSEPRPL